jgi:hypothetical protein
MSTEVKTEETPKHVYLEDLTNDHKTWISELKLQRHQVEIFQKRLADVLFRTSDHDVQARAEQFQNKFIRQFEIIDILDHDIKLDHKKLEVYAKEHPVALDHIYFQDHVKMRDQIFTNSRLFQDLRDQFYLFVEKWI